MHVNRINWVVGIFSLFISKILSFNFNIRQVSAFYFYSDTFKYLNIWEFRFFVEVRLGALNEIILPSPISWKKTIL